MPGKKGMVNSKPRRNAVRRKVWQSMRIMRRFTTPDLCRTASATESNVRKFVRRLAIHGYVAVQTKNQSGFAGSRTVWRLVRDVGPDYPMRCDRCGRPLGAPCEKEDGCKTK